MRWFQSKQIAMQNAMNYPRWFRNDDTWRFAQFMHNIWLFAHIFMLDIYLIFAYCIFFLSMIRTDSIAIEIAIDMWKGKQKSSIERDYRSFKTLAIKCRFWWHDHLIGQIITETSKQLIHRSLNMCTLYSFPFNQPVSISCFRISFNHFQMLPD